MARRNAGPCATLDSSHRNGCAVNATMSQVRGWRPAAHARPEEHHDQLARRRQRPRPSRRRPGRIPAAPGESCRTSHMARSSPRPSAGGRHEDQEETPIPQGLQDLARPTGGKPDPLPAPPGPRHDAAAPASRATPYIPSRKPSRSIDGPRPDGGDDVPDGPPEPDARRTPGGRSSSARKVMLLARGISGVRKTAKKKMPSAAATKRSSVGRARSAARAESQVLKRKIRSPLRVASAYAVQRNGATVATPGMMELSSADLGGRKADLPPQGGEIGFEDTDGDEIPEVIGGEIPGAGQQALQEASDQQSAFGVSGMPGRQGQPELTPDALMAALT